MTCIRFVAAAAILAIVVFAGLGAGPAKAGSCKAAAGHFLAVRKQGDRARMINAYKPLTAPATGCGSHIIHCAGDSLARAYVEDSYRSADEGGTPDEIRGILDKGKIYGSPWQLLVGLGDTYFADGQQRHDAKAFEHAAANYQDAVDVISEEPVCRDFDEPAPPTAAQITPIHKRMTEALLLAPQFQIIRTREGNCGGIFLASVRGFTPTFRPIPVNFVFAKSTFTAAGSKAAKVLLSCLKEEDYTKVVLSGHTDPVGSPSYNLALSKQRLDAVAAYLRKGGFKGTLVLVPKGESELFQPDDPTAYTQDELYQLDRRVVLRETKK